MSLFRSQESIGKSNFDNCQNRTIEHTDFVFETYGGITQSDDFSKDTRIFYGSSAKLHCPKTDNSLVTVEVQALRGQDRDKALKNLKKEAGAQVCRVCVYAPMSPLEVSQYDAQIAKSELEKVELLKARSEAIAELAEKDPAYRHMS